MEILSLRFAGLCAFGAAACRILPARCTRWVLAALGTVWCAAGGPECFAAVTASLLLSAIGGNLLIRRKNEGKKTGRTLVFFAAAEILLMLLGRGRVPGISFYGLVHLGYLFDCSSGECARPLHPVSYAAGAAFFPLMTEGPIVRASLFSDKVEHAPRTGMEQVAEGLLRVLKGLVKKLILAERLGIAVRTVYSDPAAFSAAAVWTAVFLYAFEMYADFSGCMDIVLGTAECFGLELPENFRQPYFAKSFSEYWQRWHITMGAWFRTFVFYPAAVSGPVMAVSKRIYGSGLSKGAKRVLSAAAPLLFTWLLTGLWHGNGVHYAVWGLANGFVLLAELALSESGRLSLPGGLRIARTFTLGALIRVLFRAESIGAAAGIYRGLFSFSAGNGITAMGLDKYDMAVAAVFLLWLVVSDLMAEHGKRVEKPAVKTAAAFTAVCALVIFGSYGPGYAPAEFFYARF